MVIKFNPTVAKGKCLRTTDFTTSGSAGITFTNEKQYNILNISSSAAVSKTASITYNKLLSMAGGADFIYIDIVATSYSLGESSAGASTSSTNTVTLTDGTTTHTLFQEATGASRWNSINDNWVTYTSPTKLLLDIKNKKIYQYDVATWYTYSGRINTSTGAQPSVYPQMTSRTIIADNTSYSTLDLNLTTLNFISVISGAVYVFGSLDFRFQVSAFANSGVF